MTPVTIDAVHDTAPDGWDDDTVDPPGGHVLQGRAWAAHRAAQGWRPRFVRFSDGRAALVVVRRQRPLPGFLAYAPRGPISAGDPPERVAARAIALGAWLRRSGGTILAVDPELDASPAYEAALAGAGFRETDEIQPSRHRMVLTFPDGATEEALFGAIRRSTRQRIRAAERAGIVVVDDPAGDHLDGFAGLVDAAAVRKGFNFAADRGFRSWWRRVLDDGRALLLVALHDGELLGGLLIYRQAGHLATAFSADRADRRRDQPGTMHLLRWEAIRRAHAAGTPSIDLGGVDTAGARHRPERDDPGWGLYEHKTAFGAAWLESAAAHELVARPWVYRAGLVARTGLRIVRRLPIRRSTAASGTIGP